MTTESAPADTIHEQIAINYPYPPQFQTTADKLAELAAQLQSTDVDATAISTSVVKELLQLAHTGNSETHKAIEKWSTNLNQRKPLTPDLVQSAAADLNRIASDFTVTNAKNGDPNLLRRPKALSTRP